jgi:glycine oxidase
MNRIVSDFLIVGGGVTGLTTACRLAEQGATVTLVDRGRTGREASWAGAGMLPPGNLAKAASAEARLRAYSHALWPQFAQTLRNETGIDNGYRTCGAIELGHTDADPALQSLREKLTDEGIAFRMLSQRGDIDSLVPELNMAFHEAIFIPDFAQVRNPRHLKALNIACKNRNVSVFENAESLSLHTVRDKVCVKEQERSFEADQVLIAAGAWSNVLLSQLNVSLPVFPVRGQMLQLRCDQMPFQCVVEQGRRYLVPRSDGLLLVGSTEDHCGFDKRTTAEAIHELLAFALELVPSLSSASVTTSWAGLRPGSQDGLPLLGRINDFDNLFVSAGHFRSGLQMSVGSAHVVADLMLGRQPEIALDGLTVDRFDSTSTERL